MIDSFIKKVMINNENNFSIGNRIVGYNKPCFFIAEIGPKS